MSSSNPDSASKVSRYVIVGGVLFPISFLLLLLVIPTSLPAVLNNLLAILGGLSLVSSVVLGFLGIRQIRSSAGEYYGIRLAVFLCLFFPIILLDLALFMVGWTFLGRITTSSLVPLAWLLLVVLLDYGIVRYTWNRAIL